jgi:DNA-binding NarL/FixJ family response regulator
MAQIKKGFVLSMAYSVTVRTCPLTPAMSMLLETAVSLGTTNNKQLAETLCVSEETIKSNFRRVNQALNTHSRSEALLRALLQGWVKNK